MSYEKVSIVRIVGVNKTKGFVGQNMKAQASVLKKYGVHVTKVDESSDEITARIHDDLLHEDEDGCFVKYEENDGFDFLNEILSKRIRSHDAKFLVYFVDGEHRIIRHRHSNMGTKRDSSYIKKKASSTP